MDAPAGRPPHAGHRRTGWLTWVGSALLLLGILAGLVNRNVLDSHQFARHADGMRRDPAVSREIGLAISRRVLQVHPELIALRPLVESASIALASSPAFSPSFEGAVQRLHGAFTGTNSGAVVFRLADVGVVVAGVLPTLSPGVAVQLPAGLDVTLASVGSGSLVADAVHWARVGKLLSWLLPLLAFVFLLAGVLLAKDRWRAAVRTGWAVVAAGVGVGVVALVAAIIASTADPNTIRGALVRAGWEQFGRPVWWAAAIAVAAGGVVVAAATARIPQVDLARESRRLADLVIRRPAGMWRRVARGIAFAAVGVGVLFRPALVFGVLGGLVGLALLIVGVGEIAAAAGAKRAPSEATAASTSHSAVRSKSQWVAAVALVTATALVVALVVVDAAPAATTSPVLVANSAACDGHVELCDRPYDDVAFAATHNSMAAADEPGWFIPEQPTGLVGQLDAGVRALLIDTWYGQTTQRPGLIATAPGSYAAALAEANQLYGPSVVESALRVRDAVTPKPTGPIKAYLCHSLCEIGATEWEPVMGQVHNWLKAHPREVITFVIQDTVTPADTAKVFDEAGLLPYVYTQQQGQPWPTLGQLIDSGKRVVVFMENHGGGATYPWLLQGFDWIQDTPFTNPTVADLSCRLERGAPSHPLFLINYWLSDFTSLVRNARRINAYDVLSPYLSKCRQERARLPNFVAVNYYNYGDLFRAVDQLNGVK